MSTVKKNKRTKPPAASVNSKPRRSLWIFVALAGIVVVVVFAAFRSSLFPPTARVEASHPVMPSAVTAAFEPTIPNKLPTPAPVPHGMVWISGGEFSMGAMEPPATTEVGMHGATDARPIHRVYVDGFWMDKTDVTNEEFARFVKATGYVTIAERTADAPGFSRRSSRESGCRSRGLFASRSSRGAQQSLSNGGRT